MIDFLPILYRKIGRNGFVLDRINYSADFFEAADSPARATKQVCNSTRSERFKPNLDT